MFRDPVAIGILLFALVMGSLSAVGLTTKTRVQTSPGVDTSIPYCWAEQHNLYLPCMYSSKEYRA